VAISFLKDFLRRTYGIMLRKDKPLSSPAQRFIAIIGARAQRDRGTSAATTRSPSEARDVEEGPEATCATSPCSNGVAGEGRDGSRS
jgi:hypothetical protein